MLLEALAITSIGAVALCMYLAYRVHTSNNKYEHIKEQQDKIDKLTGTVNLLSTQLRNKDFLIEDLQRSVDNKEDKIMKLQVNQGRVESLRKSSEVRLGQMAENFMPFIRDYPYDHKRFRFLANPVDGLQVTDDAIIFIEFKTGGARLSKTQKHIKNLVADGRVRFETFRVNEDGPSLKLESEMTDFTLSNTEPYETI